MRVGRLRKMGRSFCCTRKCQKGRKWRESQSKGGNLLNTDLIVAREWKTSTVSFKACTGVTVEGGIEGFLDAKVIPKIEINPTSVNTFGSIMGSTGGPSICALTFIYGAAYGAGIAFSYAGDTRLAQFYFNSGNYGIRFF